MNTEKDIEIIVFESDRQSYNLPQQRLAYEDGVRYGFNKGKELEKGKYSIGEVRKVILDYGYSVKDTGDIERNLDKWIWNNLIT